MIELRLFEGLFFVFFLHFIYLLVFFSTFDKLFEKLIFILLFPFVIFLLILHFLVSFLFLNNSPSLYFSSEFVFLLDSIDIIEKCRNDWVFDFLFNVSITELKLTLDELFFFVVNLDSVESFTLLIPEQGFAIGSKKLLPLFHIDRLYQLR